MRSVGIDIFFFIIVGLFIFLIAIGIYEWMMLQSEKIYCYNLYKSSFYKLPNKCKKYFSFVEKIYLNYSLEKIEKAIAIYAAKCWLRADRGALKKNLTCFSIEIVNKSTYNKLLDFDVVREYLKMYSDVPPKRLYVYPDNRRTYLVKEKKVLLIFYNGTHIIIW